MYRDVFCGLGISLHLGTKSTFLGCEPSNPSLIAVGIVGESNSFSGAYFPSSIRGIKKSLNIFYIIYIKN